MMPSRTPLSEKMTRSESSIWSSVTRGNIPPIIISARSVSRPEIRLRSRKGTRNNRSNVFDLTRGEPIPVNVFDVQNLLLLAVHPPVSGWHHPSTSGRCLASLSHQIPGGVPGGKPARRTIYRRDPVIEPNCSDRLTAPNGTLSGWHRGHP